GHAGSAFRPDGTGPRRVTGSRGDCSHPAWAPDGGAIYLTAIPDLGPDGTDFVARYATLCRVPADGGDLEVLLDPETTDRGDETPATVVTDAGVLFGV